MAAAITVAGIPYRIHSCRLAHVKTCSLLPSLSSMLCLSHFAHQRALAPARKFVTRAARTVSKRVSLGFRPPDFELSEPLTGTTWTLEDFEAYPALLVMFICNHCPFVIHLKKDIVMLTNYYMKKGLAVVAISSNSVITHPQDGPDYMAEDAKRYNYSFPYLYDESQDVAIEFGAVCTPEFFLFKKDGRKPFELVYHGQFDDSRPNNKVPVTGRDLSLAIDNVLSFQPVSSVQKPRIKAVKLEKFIIGDHYAKKLKRVGCGIRVGPRNIGLTSIFAEIDGRP